MSVYAIQAVDGGPIKIGYSTNPALRLAQLQTSHHSELVVLYSFEADSRHESSLHEALRDLHIRGEWYADDPNVLVFLRTTEIGIRLETLLRAVCRESINKLGRGFNRETVASLLHAFAEDMVEGLVGVNDAFDDLKLPGVREELRA